MIPTLGGISHSLFTGCYSIRCHQSHDQAKFEWETWAWLLLRTVEEYTIQIIEGFRYHRKTAKGLPKNFILLDGKTVPSEEPFVRKFRFWKFSPGWALHPSEGAEIEQSPVFASKPSANFNQSQTCMIVFTQELTVPPPFPRHHTSRRKHQSETDAPRGRLPARFPFSRYASWD